MCHFKFPITLSNLINKCPGCNKHESFSARSSQQPCNKYLLPNGLWKSPINLTLSRLALKQRSLATAGQVPARCWVKLCRDLVTNQIYKLGMCCSVKDMAQAWWLASTWLNGIGCQGFSRGFLFFIFFSMVENKSSCLTCCSNESHLLRTRKRLMLFVS